jgi:sugar (pentulose or hexulose) kinase
MSSSQAAVASGSGLRKWTWSQITFGIFGLPIIVVAALKAGCGAANVAAAHPQFHPGRAAAILSGWHGTISALGDC